MDDNYNQIQQDPQKPTPTIKDCLLLYELLPVSNIDKNIDALTSIIYEQEDLLNEFIQKVDDRLTISKEDSVADFIKCEFNRDTDSYRSPHSNHYFPPLNNGRYPSKELRVLEVLLTPKFQEYTRLYYSPSAISSVYCTELDSSMKDGFFCAVLIKNIIKTSGSEGLWNSNNVITITFSEKGTCVYGEYKLISTVMLSMGFEYTKKGNVDLSGTLSRKSVLSVPLHKGYLDYDTHVATIGSMIEDMETQLRNSIENIYVMKTKEVINTARYNPNMTYQNAPHHDDIKKAFNYIHG